MIFDRVTSLSALSFTVWLLVAQHAFAEWVPPAMLKLWPGGYVYADYPGVFDDVEGDGITIEAWIYLEGRPKDNLPRHESAGKWIIVAKPGSYLISVDGRELDRDADLPTGAVFFRYKTEYVYHRGTDKGGSGSVGYIFLPHKFPFRDWIHVALQIVGDDEGARAQTYYDGNKRGPSGIGSGGPIRQTEAPLIIGGCPKSLTFENGSVWRESGFYESMKGYIDEVRVSKGFRYGAILGNLFRPNRRFQADGRTIALWRFEEGPGSRTYHDSSGNGYTLFAGGSLATAVDPRDKLATTWGSLKRRAQAIK